MRAYYPRYISNPSGPDKPEIKVETAEEHERVHPKDYAAFQDELDAVASGPPPFDPAASIAEERERCAVVAETFTSGGKIGMAIAKAIRGQVDGPAKVEVPVSYRAKLLSNPNKSLVKDDVYTVEQADGQFTQPDMLVESAEAERAAKTAGFTVEIPTPKR